MGRGGEGEEEDGERGEWGEWERERMIERQGGREWGISDLNGVVRGRGE